MLGLGKYIPNINLTEMKNNEDLQKDVQDAIKWEPLLNAAEIGVTVSDGIVTLSGTVDSYVKKLEAERAAKNVAGVKAIVEKIEVRFSNSWSKSDSEIAVEVLNAWKWNWQVPSDKIRVKVEDGWITLEGELTWNYQSEAAKNAVHHLMGVRGVTNNITIKPNSNDTIEQHDVESALERNGSIDASDIFVKVSGTKVTLSGTVNSWYDKVEAARTAWNTPGIWKVENELEVEYDYTLID